MYVVDIGIVYWASVSDSPILQGGRQEALAIADGIRIETVTIPSTGHRRRSNGRSLDDSLDARYVFSSSFIPHLYPCESCKTCLGSISSIARVWLLNNILM